MVFSMNGGGLEFHIPILKNDFFENHLELFHSLSVKMCFALSLGFTLCIYSS